jgi:hypothetical protein
MRTPIRSLLTGLAGAFLVGCGSGGSSNATIDLMVAVSVAGEAPRLLGGGLRGEGLVVIDGASLAPAATRGARIARASRSSPRTPRATVACT